MEFMWNYDVDMFRLCLDGTLEIFFLSIIYIEIYRLIQLLLNVIQNGFSFMIKLNDVFDGLSCIFLF